ncbi:uncharacterized protein LOC113500243 [Trichoplusia ni]|uniref:Uncharacterized protein LOC113500243 n=1 Tax=Trichoplusia ni TaxID=7111 RepID=A0A7E5W7Z2_TRINI|nr:uncharacterized protein LOC113500243 [Trichoplusia ni]
MQVHESTEHDTAKLFDDPIEVVSVNSTAQYFELIKDNAENPNVTAEDNDISFRSDFLKKKHSAVNLLNRNHDVMNDGISTENEMHVKETNDNLENVFLIMNTDPDEINPINKFEIRRLNKNGSEGKFSIDKDKRIIDSKFRRTGNLDVNKTFLNGEGKDYNNGEFFEITTFSESGLRNEDQIGARNNVNENVHLRQTLIEVDPDNPEYGFANFDVLNGAIGILHRIKRSTKKHERKLREVDKSKHDEVCQQCKDLYKHLENDLEDIPEFRMLKPENLINILKYTKFVEKNDCPLSIFFKLALKKVYDRLSRIENVLLKSLLRYLNNLIEGKVEVINLVTKKLTNIPFPMKLRLQLLQDPAQSIKEIMSYTTSIICQ